MKYKIKLNFIFILFSFYSFCQNGAIKGIVKDEKGEVIPFSNIYIVEQEKGTSSDIYGKYKILDIPGGVYTLKVSSVGYSPLLITDIEITSNRTLTFEHILEKIKDTMNEVKVIANPFKIKNEAPTGFRTLNSTEIQRYPGANRDVSRVIQALPGVAQIASFRNDVIVRGGSPGENKFYLDGFEVPNINHFATQGAGGGPVGLLNVNFIREVDFYASSFPANQANALSSVLSFKQKNGNPDRLLGTFTVGLSDAGLTLDGPLGKKADFIFSTRISYQQLLFKLLRLPFLPTYYDTQFKFSIKPNKKNRITIIGLGALDLFKLNESVNDGIEDEETLKRNNYTLSVIPTNNQWNYTIGVKYEHFGKSRQTVYLSQNQLNNRAFKFKDNQNNDPTKKILDYNSSELENKLRFENLWLIKGWKIIAGAGYEWAYYKNATFNRINNSGNEKLIDFQSQLHVHKFSIFSQVTKSFFNKILTLSAGIRSDFTPYNKNMINPLNQLSPNLGIKVKMYKTLFFNLSGGINHQLPAYTMLGYRNSIGELINQDKLKYIRVKQISSGFEYTGNWNGRFTLEGFYKDYSNYPFSINKQISLANLGAGFGVVGNEPVNSTSRGRSYGVEFLYQQKMKKGFYGILSYTFVKSEFRDKNNQYVSSSWDSRHILSLSAGKRFKKGWELGVRWVYSGGSPFTPINIELSTTPGIWELAPAGQLDYSLLNTERTQDFHRLDIRVDKKFNFKKWSLNLYLDIQNIYNFKSQGEPYLLVETDKSKEPIIDTNTGKYKHNLVSNSIGRVLPTIGIIAEFPLSKKR